MKLSPLEIKKQEFARAFRGYDVEEVQAFLQMVSSQWESLLEENRRLEEQVRDYQNKIEHYEKVEEALQDALETARQTAKEKVANAEERATHLIEEAAQKAERITGEAQQDRYAMKREVSKLKHRREEIVARLRAFLMSEMEMLAQYEEDDPVGFIKFLPQEDEEGPDEDSPDEAVEEMVGPRELPGGPEAHQRAESESTPDAPRRERPGGSPEKSVEASTVESSYSGSSGLEEVSSQPSGTSSPDPERAHSTEHEPPAEKKQRWRVHSVVSSPPGSKKPEEREGASPESGSAESSEPASQQPEQEIPSSEEMDKIRRILDDLE